MTLIYILFIFYFYFFIHVRIAKTLILNPYWCCNLFYSKPGCKYKSNREAVQKRIISTHLFSANLKTKPYFTFNKNIVTFTCRIPMRGLWNMEMMQTCYILLASMDQICFWEGVVKRFAMFVGWKWIHYFWLTFFFQIITFEWYVWLTWFTIVTHRSITYKTKFSKWVWIVVITDHHLRLLSQKRKGFKWSKSWPVFGQFIYLYLELSNIILNHFLSFITFFSSDNLSSGLIIIYMLKFIIDNCWASLISMGF